MDQPLDRRGLWLLGVLAAVVGSGYFFRTHDWEWGRQRCLLLLVLAVAVVVARPALPVFLKTRNATIAIWIAALVSAGLDLRTGIESVRLAAATGEIRLDQGQDTLRAAQLLLRGEDPYAKGQLLDPEAYMTRGRQRVEAGMPSPRDWPYLLDHWWRTLDPRAREKLLPPSDAKERALYGYKYGPLLPLVTAPLQAAVGPAAVPLLQLLFWAMLLALLRDPLVILCVSLEPSVATNYLYYSASDIWALAWMAAALFAWQRKRAGALGVFAGAAIGCKLAPSLLLAPLLANRRALIACAATVAVLFGPFAIADPAGFWANLVSWPSAMRPDNTHWSFYASEGVRIAARVVLGAGIVAAMVYLRNNTGLAVWLRYLAAASCALILGGVAFHNNYVPWFTVWALSAVSASAQQPAASGNR